MKAVYIAKHGPVADLKVTDVAVPVVTSSSEQVLVRIEAAGINPSDVASAEGRFPHAVLPRIVGRDFAGTVVQGPAELIGQRVWGSGDLGITRDGTHAEYIVLPRHAAARRPNKLSVEQAAAVGVPFVAAFSAMVTLGRIEAGQWVIVSGAAGAVGGAAIQIARAKGAHAVALLRDARDRERVKAQGVDGIAQSDRGDLETVVRELTHGRGADLALNGVGSSVFAAMTGALASGGRLVVYSVIGGREATIDLFAFYRKRLALFGLDTQALDATACAAILDELAPMFESGALRPPAVAEQCALADAPKAYARVKAGGSGKIVLAMPTAKPEDRILATSRSEKS